MPASTRMPGGSPNRCPVCGKYVRLEVSQPAGDAPCPSCGALLWFVDSDDGLQLYDKRRFRFSAVEPGLAIGVEVRISTGGFESFEGTVESIDAATGVATVMVAIYGREIPVEVPQIAIERV